MNNETIDPRYQDANDKWSLITQIDKLQTEKDLLQDKLNAAMFCLNKMERVPLVKDTINYITKL